MSDLLGPVSCGRTAGRPFFSSPQPFGALESQAVPPGRFGRPARQLAGVGRSRPCSATSAPADPLQPRPAPAPGQGSQRAAYPASVAGRFAACFCRTCSPPGPRSPLSARSGSTSVRRIEDAVGESTGVSVAGWTSTERVDASQHSSCGSFASQPGNGSHSTSSASIATTRPRAPSDRSGPHTRPRSCASHWRPTWFRERIISTSIAMKSPSPSLPQQPRCHHSPLSGSSSRRIRAAKF